MTADAAVLEKELCKFPALKQLDVSANPGLRLLPVGLLRVAAMLETFKCDGCPLLLPPQSIFSTPDRNPGRIKEFLQGCAACSDLNLSDIGLTPSVASEVAALLQFVPSLKQIDISSNPFLVFLPVGILRVASSLETFQCDGCSLLLPPQSFFSTPEQNPSSINCLFQDCILFSEINLSSVELTPEVAFEAAAVLKHMSVLRLDISANSGLGAVGVFSLLMAFECIHHCFGCFCYICCSLYFFSFASSSTN